MVEEFSPSWLELTRFMFFKAAFIFSLVGSEIPMPCLKESSMCNPADLPNTTKSKRELPPRRFPPCTETHAASPAA